MPRGVAKSFVVNFVGSSPFLEQKNSERLYFARYKVETCRELSYAKIRRRRLSEFCIVTGYSTSKAYKVLL